ncbi:MAG: S8 family serine peptidase [Acidobacteriia bacterium]|nr:S8 family serine peptidase [Terriglobia bacterium]
MRGQHRIGFLIVVLAVSIWPATLGATKVLVRKTAVEPAPGRQVTYAAVDNTHLKAQGASVLADYGAYYLVEIPQTNLDRYTQDIAAAEYRLSVMDSYDVVSVNGYTFPSKGTLPQLPSDLVISDYTGSKGLYIMQSVGPNRAEWYEALRSVGEPIGYFPDNTFLVRAKPGQLSALAKANFVQHLSVYQPAYKLRADVRDAEGPVLATVQLDGGQDLADAIAILEGIAGEKVSFEPSGPIRNASLWLTPSEARLLAALPEVLWIEQKLPSGPSDERQALATAGKVYNEGGAVRPTPPAAWPGAYQRWLEAMGFCTSTKITNCTAFATKIAVFDSGLDRNVCGAPPATCHGAGDVPTPHPDFGSRQYRFLCATNSRSVPQCLGLDPGYPTKYDYSDGFGHGTAVAAAIAGDPVAGVAATPTPTPAPASLDQQGYFLGTGSAPKATLVTYRIWNSAGKAILDFGATDMERWHAEVYNAGGAPRVMRFANHSWNNLTDIAYTAMTQKFDQLVRDSDGGYNQWDRPITLVVSAGNDEDQTPGDRACDGIPQPRESHVTAPGNAKNVISVGATEEWRPSDYPYYPWGDIACAGYSSLNNLACFSRRSPQNDSNRRKPDFVAAGNRIGSAVSRGGVSASGCWAKPTPNDPNDPNRGYYLRTSGTSFSAPVVTGAAALAETWCYWRNGQTLPSPALLKALLVANADSLAGGIDDMTGATMSGYKPNYFYGWGRPNLDALFQTTVPVKFYDEDHTTQGTARFTPGKSAWSVNLTRSNPTLDVIVVMAFTDRFALTNASRYYVNNLDLFVFNGPHYFQGNVLDSQGYTLRDQGDLPDMDNNVEMIRIRPADLTSSTFTVQVYPDVINGNAVPGLDGNGPNQDFAVYVYNAQ